MFFEVLSPIYHSPITIESFTYRVLLGTLGYSSQRVLDCGWSWLFTTYCVRLSAPFPRR
jgi:hypothetical protein